MLALLGDSDAILSGSFPLLLARRQEDAFELGDIDVYVNDSGHDVLVKELRSFGYRLLDVGVHLDDYSCNNSAILGGVETYGKGSKYLNVVGVAGTDPRAAMFLFHSTVVMNYIDAVSINIAHPRLTLKGLLVRKTVIRPIRAI